MLSKPLVLKLTLSLLHLPSSHAYTQVGEVLNNQATAQLALGNTARRRNLTPA